MNEAVIDVCRVVVLIISVKVAVVLRLFDLLLNTNLNAILVI